MDRDASFPPTSPDDAVPPVAPPSVRTTALVGLGLTGIATLLGLVAYAAGDDVPAVLNRARLFLVLIGIITSGAAISMRPDLWWAWAIGAVTAGLGVGGLPGHWDSFRLVLWVLTSVALAGAAICALPVVWRMAVASAIILFHFTGIYTAATSPVTDPMPAPWVTTQAFGRIYNPYLQFVYLRNAYHFYSPNPGPASVLAFFLKTETGTDPATGAKQYKTEWVVIPKRPADIRDPLGLTYYRKLSLTEQLARGSPGLLVPDQFEKTEMSFRRTNRQQQYPFHPVELLWNQYKLPNSDVSRFLLPSYASHIILENTPDADTAARTTVKIYRMEHRSLAVDQFATRVANGGQYPSVYIQSTYRPYFMGEFDARGNLVDPQEDMLYWLLPIMPRTPSPNDPDDPFKKWYFDYMSAHALGWSREEVLKADESKGQVFNWSQLR